MPSLKNVPIVTLRDMVVYPHGVQPLFIGTEKSIRALEHAQKHDKDKQVLLVAKRNPENDAPGPNDLFAFGTVATILQLIRLPDKTVKILVEGGQRAEITEIRDADDFFVGDLNIVEETRVSANEAEALVRSMMAVFDQYVQFSKKVPPEVMASLSSIEDPSRLVDTIAAQMSLKLDEKQRILEMSNLDERIEHMMKLLEAEIDLFNVEKRIRAVSRSRWRRVSASTT